MKILHCIPTLSTGGAERQLSVLAPAQSGLGFQVHVAYVHSGPFLENLERSEVALHQLSAVSNYDPRLVLGLGKVISRVGPDVVHTWLPMMDVVGGALALIHRRAWVLSERSGADAYLHRFTDRVLRDRLGRYANAIVANSEAGRGHWRGRLRPPAAIHVVPNALPLARIAMTPPADLSTLKVPVDAPVIIFAGRLSWEKNIPLLVAVVERVCAASDATFLVCGDGPERELVCRAIESDALAGRVRVLGSRSDVWALMKASDLFISTSSFEGQPNAVLEAMACGCPLVVSDIPAHREFLNPSNAVLASMNADDFGNAVLQVLASPNAARERAARASEVASKNSPSSAARAYAAIYEEAIRRRARCAA